MDCFSTVSRGALLLINTVAVVKSIDIALIGGLLMALEPLLRPVAASLHVVSRDGVSEVALLALSSKLALFLVIASPCMALVACVGLHGARQKSVATLAVYILLMIVVLVLTILAAVLGFPKPLSNPTESWEPFSNLLLASIVCACGLEGVTIFFAMVLISSLNAEKKIHPEAPKAQPRAVKALKSQDRRHSLQ